jgi:hypothetical protein
MVKSILATDMAFHAPMISQFKEQKDNLDPENPKDKEVTFLTIKYLVYDGVLTACL